MQEKGEKTPRRQSRRESQIPALFLSDSGYLPEHFVRQPGGTPQRTGDGASDGAQERWQVWKIMPEKEVRLRSG